MTSKPLPPPLYDVSDKGLYWTFSLEGQRRTVTITKAAKDLALRRISGAGKLVLHPAVSGVSEVPYGSWALEAQIIKTTAAKKRDIRTLGCILVIRIKSPVDQGWSSIPFAFQSERESRTIKFWVGHITRNLKRAMKKPSPS